MTDPKSSNQQDQMGSTLVEAIVALAIAAVGLTAFLTTCGVLLQSRAISQELFDQGASINAIHSEVSQFISSHPGESIQTLQAGADAVADRYPDCRLELSAEGPRLYSLVIIFTPPMGGEQRYCGKIYTDS